jgi:hypothetical protein
MKPIQAASPAAKYGGRLMGFLKHLFGSNSEDKQITAIDAGSLGGTGRRRKIEVVGEYYHETELIKIAGRKTRQSANIETTAALVPDPKNRHDGNAVEVRIDGRLVAYLSREQAVGYHRLMTEAGHPSRALANVEARIFGGRIGEDGYEAAYGVALYLPESLAKMIGYGIDPRQSTSDD